MCLFLKDIITFGLTIWGLIVATQGLFTWRKQIKGNKEFEVSYDLNYSILKLREAIKYVRNPAIRPSESYKAIQYAKEKYIYKTQEDIEKNSHPYVYEMRWEKITNAFTEVESHLLGAEVLWGKDILTLMHALNLKITELNITLQQNFQPDLRTKNAKEIHNVMYDQRAGPTGEDDFSKEITKSIEDIRDYLKNRGL